MGYDISRGTSTSKKSPGAWTDDSSFVETKLKLNYRLLFEIKLRTGINNSILNLN